MKRRRADCRSRDSGCRQDIVANICPRVGAGNTDIPGDYLSRGAGVIGDVLTLELTRGRKNNGVTSQQAIDGRRSAVENGADCTVVNLVGSGDSGHRQRFRSDGGGPHNRRTGKFVVRCQAGTVAKLVSSDRDCLACGDVLIGKRAARPGYNQRFTANEPVQCAPRDRCRCGLIVLFVGDDETDCDRLRGD